MRVLIADDHTIVRNGLCAILRQAGTIEVVGEASDGRDAVEMTRRLDPDVVLIDVSMPVLNGVDATRLIKRVSPRTKVIALSMHSDRRYVLAMLAAGASGYLLKIAAAEELIRAVTTVGSGEKYLSPAIAEIVIDSATRPKEPAPPESPCSELTTREREVLQLIAEGASSKEIAQKLSIAVSTVETHRRQIGEKLNLRSVAELTKYAIRAGLTSIGE